jgi:hypothetical protein
MSRGEDDWHDPQFEKWRRQDTRMRCDACGRFVGMNGSRRLVTPDSDRSSEEYETLCPAHRDQPDVAQSSGDGRV